MRTLIELIFDMVRTVTFQQPCRASCSGERRSQPLGCLDHPACG
jgi:hypothetical protein